MGHSQSAPHVCRNQVRSEWAHAALVVENDETVDGAHVGIEPRPEFFPARLFRHDIALRSLQKRRAVEDLASDTPSAQDVLHGHQSFPAQSAGDYQYSAGSVGQGVERVNAERIGLRPVAPFVAGELEGLRRHQHAVYVEKDDRHKRGRDRKCFLDLAAQAIAPLADLVDQAAHCKGSPAGQADNGGEYGDAVQNQKQAGKSLSEHSLLLWLLEAGYFLERFESALQAPAVPFLPHGGVELDILPLENFVANTQVADLRHQRLDLCGVAVEVAT